MQSEFSSNTLTINQKNVVFDKYPVRILHVVASMNRGGIETWLMGILRHIDRERFQMDFLVHTTEPCAYDDEIRALNSRIIPCLHPSRPWTYASNFQRILRENGPYDIVHTHVHLFSGYILRLAQQTGVPVRIAHTHTDTSSIDARAGWLRRAYYTLAKWWINRYATVGLGVNRNAIADLFGSVCETDPRWKHLCCGINLTVFRDPIDRIAVRTHLGIPTDAFVIGHVGRFVEAKNHTFILDIIREIAQREPKIYLLLVGDGSLRSNIEHKAVQLGLANRVIFTGVRSDVAKLMRGAMDIFLFPSLYEGQGIVQLEAQSAGLPCFLSDVIPNEGDVVKPLVHRLSLSQKASDWAEAILAVRQSKITISQIEALRLVEQSLFNILTGVKDLEKIYLTQAQTSFR
ncbi:glycosyltransferase family 1 protein [Scytonema sp. NUACC26]|uniref:glycosyltransferase family 1 protein n=1 Tax=Scytonema sp. NUACC26 TaxID=3140176 RepID=UPI0034DC3556